MRLALALIVIGIILIIAGSMLVALSAQGEISGGFVILIGPIPIIGGVGPHGTLLALLALLVTLIIVIIYIIHAFLSTKLQSAAEL